MGSTPRTVTKRRARVANAKPSGGCLFYIDRFGVHEFPNAKDGQFPAVAGLFDAAKGQAGIGFNKSIDKATTGFQLFMGYPFAPRRVTGEHGRAESKVRTVGQRDGFG